MANFAKAANMAHALVPSSTSCAEPPAKRRRIMPSSGGRLSTPGPDNRVLVFDETFTLNLAYHAVRDEHDSTLPYFEDKADLVLIHNVELTPDDDDAVATATLSRPDGSPQSIQTFLLRRPDQAYSTRLQHILSHVSQMRQRDFSKSFLNEKDQYWAESFLIGTYHSGCLAVRLKIYWRIDAPSVLKGKKLAASHHFLSSFLLHDQWYDPSRPFQPQDFYNCVHLPDSSKQRPSWSDILGLECDLYPFQMKAVDWLLRREGVAYNSDGCLENLPFHTTQLPTSFHRWKDREGRTAYVSPLLQQIRWNIDDELSRANFRGGILAEEMGLGKTVELIALILAHPRQEELKPFWDPSVASTIHPSNATLIITPPAILEQWMTELQNHAPTLRVFHYEGLKASKTSDSQLMDLLMQQDVVLTTYQVLAREIHYANDKPQRDLRHTKVYKPPRTPLVQLQWWRVCLDEAQMIESGVSNAAKVARLIPRCNAWAVSGTPLRKNVMDLLGLLIFLRYEPFCDAEVWKLLVSSHSLTLRDVLSRIALRHTKAKIRDQLILPPQKRMVITVPFTATEEQNYSNLFRRMCDECGLNQDGSPIDGYWDPTAPSTIEKMRNWLTRLRQTCLHAEIGQSNRRALGNRHGPLRTVDEVLQVMMDQNETQLRLREREVLSRKITRGHIHSFGKESKRALEIYLEALDEAKKSVSECREHLESEKAKVAAKSEGEVRSENKGSGSEDSDDDESERGDTKGRLLSFRQHLRSALEMLHVCYFFSGTAYFQVKDDKSQTEPDSESFQELEKKEVECYEEAKLVRRELLRHVAKNTTRMVEKVVTAKDKSFVHFSVIPEFKNPPGLESRKAIENVENLRSMLNDQATHFEEWRSKLVNTLLERLIDHDDDVEMTGEEYENTTKKQDEQYVLLEALRCVQSDRQCMLTGQIGTLINHEMKSAARLATDGAADDSNNKGPAPELMVSLVNERKSFNPPDNIRATTADDAIRIKALSLRGIMTDIRQMVTAIQWQSTERGKVENLILDRELHNLQRVFQTQQKELTAMESELDLLRSAMNQRLEYYRQLQQLSDMVAPYQEEMGDEIDVVRLSEQQRQEDVSSQKLSQLKTKRRFLIHLRATESNDKQEQKLCVICQSNFETGLLTVCGHQYCKDCIRMWWSEHRTCPMCKTYLRSSDFHEVTYKPQELRAREEPGTSSQEQEHESPTKTTPTKAAIYSDINPEALYEINNIDLPTSGSYGSKIDTLARHLLWLRQTDPGSKSVIFTQYRDFLGVLERAFKTLKIGCSNARSPAGIKRFREDPSVECFLLDAKAESSGLMLVNATHVFLCEPLINTAIELQAIARVHRIGQRRPTTVWMYLVANTVEEAIYDISVTRRLSHIQRSSSASASAFASRQLSRAATPSAADDKGVEESKLDTANSLELQTVPISQLLAKGQSSGEVVANGDIWSCLFSGKSTRPMDSVSGALGLAGNNLPSDSAGEREVARFLRADAAETRRDQSMAGASASQ